MRPPAAFPFCIFLSFLAQHFACHVPCARPNSTFTWKKLSDVNLTLHFFNQSWCAVLSQKLKNVSYQIVFQHDGSLHRYFLKVTNDSCYQLCGNVSLNSSFSTALLNHQLSGNLSECSDHNNNFFTELLDINTLISFGVCLGLMFLFAIVVLIIRCTGRPIPIPEDLQRVELFRQIFIRRFAGRPDSNNDEAVAEKLMALERFARLRAHTVDGSPSRREKEDHEEAPRYQKMSFTPTLAFERHPARSPKMERNDAQKPRVVYHRATASDGGSEDLSKKAEPKADNFRPPVPKPRTRREPSQGSTDSPTTMIKPRVFVREVRGDRSATVPGRVAHQPSNAPGGAFQFSENYTN